MSNLQPSMCHLLPISRCSITVLRVTSLDGEVLSCSNPEVALRQKFVVNLNAVASFLTVFISALRLELLFHDEADHRVVPE